MRQRFAQRERHLMHVERTLEHERDNIGGRFAA